MTMLEAQKLTCRVKSGTKNGQILVEQISFAVQPGKTTMLIGPNGSGKTTLLRALAGLIRPDAGAVLLGNRPIGDYSPADRARELAYLPQDRSFAWSQPVRDMVALGRFAYGGSPGKLATEDERAIASAIHNCGIDGLADRMCDTLSGGERARVHLARAFAAQTPVLIADEPVAALDPKAQHDMLQLFADAARQGCAVLVVVHDLALAARYADHLLWLQNGHLVAQGSVQDTLTPERLRDIFGVETVIHETDGMMVPIITRPV
ncbi:MAG: ABC transporter ATP-binding protein, partial [Sphingomonadaceae bacterium]